MLGERKKSEKNKVTSHKQNLRKYRILKKIQKSQHSSSDKPL